MFMTKSWKDPKYCTSVGKSMFMAVTTIAHKSYLLLKKDFL